MAHTARKQSPCNDSDGLGVDPDLAVSHCKEDTLSHFEAGELWGEVNLVPSHHGGCVGHLGVNGRSQVARRTDGHGLAPEGTHQSKAYRECAPKTIQTAVTCSRIGGLEELDPLNSAPIPALTCAPAPAIAPGNGRCWPAPGP